MNYGNRNATSNYTNNDILKGYAVACVASIGTALLIRKGFSSYTKNMKGAKLVVMNSISSFFACSTAGFLNAYFMRQSELDKGIEVFDPEDHDQVVGISKVAAKKAVMETAISRYVLCVTLFLPALALYGIERAHLMPRNRILCTALELSLFFGELYLAVPLAIALYPQYGKVSEQDIEPSLRVWKNQQGHHLKEFMYNKGL